MGKLVGFNTITGDKVCDTDVCSENVITVTWHAVLNQIFLGLSNSNIMALYNPTTSKQGVLRCIVKQEKRKAVEGRALYTS